MVTDSGRIVTMLWTCPTCNGKGTVEVRRQSRHKGEGEEVDQVDCNTCDGSGQLESPPA